MPRAISLGIEGGSVKSRRFATRPPQTPPAGDGGAACQHWDKLVNLPRSGGVVERSIAPVLKTGDPQGSVGSNPTPSAIRRSRLETFPWDENAVRAGDRSLEATNPTFLVLRMGKRPATGMSPLHYTKGPSHIWTLSFGPGVGSASGPTANILWDSTRPVQPERSEDGP